MVNWLARVRVSTSGFTHYRNHVSLNRISPFPDFYFFMVHFRKDKSISVFILPISYTMYPLNIAVNKRQLLKNSY